MHDEVKLIKKITKKFAGLSTDTNSINYCVCKIMLHVSVLEVIQYILY